MFTFKEYASRIILCSIIGLYLSIYIANSVCNLIKLNKKNVKNSYYLTYITFIIMFICNIFTLYHMIPYN